jgi:type IV secretory pathway VirB10-like protein
MRAMMFKARQAAILIAVFLLIGLNGCYTKFRQAKVKLVPDDNNTVIYDDWDFSRGWYRDGIEVYSTYYDYYYAQWWDQSPRRSKNAEAQVIETEPAGKIERRDYGDWPFLDQFDQSDSIPQHPYEYSGPGLQDQPPKVDNPPPANADQPKVDNPPPANSDQPKVKNDDNQSKDNQKNTNENKSDDTKIKRRGGR